MKVIDYYVADGETLDELLNDVADAIRNGWQPFGSIAVSIIADLPRYYQAMVMYE